MSKINKAINKIILNFFIKDIIIYNINIKCIKKNQYH